MNEIDAIRARHEKDALEMWDDGRQDGPPHQAVVDRADLLKAFDAEVEKNRVLRETLEWYQIEAVACARAFDPVNVTSMQAILHVLALDAGNRAKTALLDAEKE